MRRELVSIITPVYKGQKSIADCVSSVQKQTYSNWEMLIISDDDWDYRVELERKGIVDERLRFFSTRGIAQGAPYARNIGLSKAQGQWITELNVDDQYYPVRLERLMHYALETGLSLDNGILVDSENGQFLGNLLNSTEETKFRLKDFKQTFAPLSFLYSKTLTANGWRELPKFSSLLFNLQLMERAGWANLAPAKLHECRVIPLTKMQQPTSQALANDSLKTLLHWLDMRQAGFEGAFYRHEVKEYISQYAMHYQQYLEHCQQGFEGHFLQFMQWSNTLSLQPATA